MVMARISQPASLVLALAVCAAGQISNRPPAGVKPARPDAAAAPSARPGITAAPPAPESGNRPLPPRPGRGGAIPAYGWGWGWGGNNVIVQEKEVEKEPSFRPWVENKEYTRELLNPVTRDYPDGALPAPKIDRTPKLAPCQLVLTSGERASSPTCERRADLVSYIEPAGRRIWLSTDLIDWARSSFGISP